MLVTGAAELVMAYIYLPKARTNSSCRNKIVHPYARFRSENVQNMTEMNLKVIKIRVYVSRIRDAF